MATTREKLAEYFFGGDSEAVGCLFEVNRDQAPIHVPGGAQNNSLIATDWMPRIATLVDNHDLGPFARGDRQGSAPGSHDAGPGREPLDATCASQLQLLGRTPEAGGVRQPLPDAPSAPRP